MRTFETVSRATSLRMLRRAQRWKYGQPIVLQDTTSEVEATFEQFLGSKNGTDHH